MRLAAAVALAALAATPAALAGEDVGYDVDGASYLGYYAAPEGDAQGLVLVIHDWDGLTDYEKRRADMLAELGYAAFAVDLFGEGNRPETTEARRAETSRLRGDRETMRSLILGGLAAAREEADLPAVIMGYCFGGGAALEIARSGAAENVEGYATFHGDLSTPEGQSYSGLEAPLLILHGGADSSVTMADVADLLNRLEGENVTYQVEIYSGAPHGFTEFDSDRYQERADQRSWDAFTLFLENNLGA